MLVQTELTQILMPTASNSQTTKRKLMPTKTSASSQMSNTHMEHQPRKILFHYSHHKVHTCQTKRINTQHGCFTTSLVSLILFPYPTAGIQDATNRELSIEEPIISSAEFNPPCTQAGAHEPLDCTQSFAPLTSTRIFTAPYASCVFTPFVCCPCCVCHTLSYTR
jgi:hypothetical protein